MDVFTIKNNEGIFELCDVKHKKSANKNQALKAEKKHASSIFNYIIKKLDLSPFYFAIGNSKTCFYCNGSLPRCGCVLLELREELEELSDDFKKLHVGYDICTHVVFNLKNLTINNANVLAYHHKEKRLLYKRYSNGLFFDRWGTGGKGEYISSGRDNEYIEIIGVELDVIYNGLCLTGKLKHHLEKNALLSRCAPPPMRITKRRAHELISL